MIKSIVELRGSISTVGELTKKLLDTPANYALDMQHNSNVLVVNNYKECIHICQECEAEDMEYYILGDVVCSGGETDKVNVEDEKLIPCAETLNMYVILGYSMNNKGKRRINSHGVAYSEEEARNMADTLVADGIIYKYKIEKHILNNDGRWRY